MTPANFRIDAWVTPPVYTGRPPVMLPGYRPGDSAQAQAKEQTREIVSVPAGSQLVVRATGGVRIEIARAGGVELAPPDPKAAVPQGSEEQRFVINGDGSAVVHGAGNGLAWQFSAIPDKPPTIELIRDPEPQARGSLRLDYRLQDDYGVVDAQATFALKESAGDKAARPLFGPPNYALALPQARTRTGTAQTIHDLTDHPWAGAKVEMVLLAHDEANNEGKSEPREFTLPQRIFVKPVARALIEQRRLLALDANAKPLVLTALEALTIAPEKFTPEAAVYLGLRSIYFDLNGAKSDDELRAVVARLWEMATQIEDGNMSQAERDLRAAQEALRQALERGASPRRAQEADGRPARRARQVHAGAGRADEEESRAAGAAARPQQQDAHPEGPEVDARPAGAARPLRQQGGRAAPARAIAVDAGKPADGAAQCRRRRRRRHEFGARRIERHDPQAAAAARQDLQEGPGPAPRPPRQRQEQERARRPAPGPEGPARPAQAAARPVAPARADARAEEARPADDKGNEMDQLGDAGESMDQAQGELGEGDADSAVEDQGKALDAMRKGAQSLAQAMQDNGFGPGPNGRPTGPQARAQNDTDPLGRPLRGHDLDGDNTVKVPGEIDAQRARRILEELRKRFGESFRPQLELDYIERLLKDF